MQSFYDYKKFAILYVDDEEKSLKYFTRAMEGQFRIYTAPNAAEGYRLFEEHKDEIAILMTDQRMPGEKGVQLLERVRQLRPKSIRILATAYSDLDAAVAAVNTGAIYKYVTKPWDVPQLEITLKRGLEFFLLQRERDALMREKMSALHNLMVTDRVISLGIVAAGLGHYVRNSLVAVRTFIDLAPTKLQEENVDIEQLRNPNYWKEFYGHVQSQIKRITELLNDLGVVSQNAEHPFQDKVQLHQVIDPVLTSLAAKLKEKEVTLLQDVPNNLPEQTVDRAKFERLFQLLLKDELTNLPVGSKVKLSAKSQTNELNNTKEVVIQLEDNGPGLPQEKLRAVFDPFFLRGDNQQEFGINLMACYFIVYHHGGRMDVENLPEGGTRFTMTFPVEPQNRSAAEDEQSFLAKVLVNDTLWERLLAGE